MSAVIENEAAYFAAVDRRIKANASKGRARRAKERLGEDRYWEIRNWVTLTANLTGSKFFVSMDEAIWEWGWLTEGQEKAVVKIMDEQIDKDHQTALLMNERKSKGGYVGTEGKRGEYSGTIKFVSKYETQYGFTYIVGVVDSEENTIVLKGSGVDLFDLYDTVTNYPSTYDVVVKGTVKCHEVRQGQKQTVLSRVKTVSFTEGGVDVFEPLPIDPRYI